MHLRLFASLRHLSFLCAALLALTLPQIAQAHDLSVGRIDVILTGTATSAHEVTLTATATPGIPVPTMILTWSLLDGGELLDGAAETSWELPPADVAVSQARRVRLPGPGIYKVGVTALLPLGESARFIDSDLLFLIVAENGGVTISAKDPNARSPMGSMMPEVPGLVPSLPAVTAAGTRAANGDPCFTVRGVIQRIERTPTRNGYLPDTLVPVRSALVEMREEDLIFDDSYGEMLTDEQGRYSFSFCDDDGLFDDELELYVRLHAQIRSPQGIEIVEVQADGLIPPEDVYEFDSVPFDSEGGTYDRNFQLTVEQSGIMNMADAVYDAWTFWNNNGGAVGDDAVFDALAEINWEAGDDLDGSYYNGYVWDHINIADGPADPDQWDDSVIIHEWNHQADDNYGCDDTPGGEHSSSQNLGDQELAWSEGYANYYQSAVRNAFGRTDGNWYLDGNAMGAMGGYDLETRDTFNAMLNTPFNEAAIAAMLWDLEDMANDNQDRTGFGPAMVQQVFTDPNFSENGDIFDDTCTAFVYLWSWVETGKPTTGDVGALVQQNIGIRPGFLNVASAASTSSATAHAEPVEAAAVAAPAEVVQAAAVAAPAEAVEAATAAELVEATVAGAPEDFRWWKNLTWVVDNSQSMAASGKLDAVKTAMKEQVNDLAAAPKGTEFNLYTFNNTSGALQQPVGQKFYADLVNPAIDGLTTVGAADADCAVGALNAIALAAQQQKGGDLWLYTDRSSTLFPTIESTKQLLNRRQIRGSFAMLGGCAGVLPTKMSDVTGGEINYLGNAANGSQSTGIVPYLLTSLGSGGQFIYVREDQLGSAADILRAQVANSAGAGKWSDYVSDNFTYRWDRLEAGEYQWFPAESLGQGQGQLPLSGYLLYTMPETFTFYGGERAAVGVSQDGFLEFDPCTTNQCTIIQLFRNYLDVLNNDMQWDFIPVPPRVAGQPTEVVAAAVAPQQLDDGTPVIPAAATADPNCIKILDGNPATVYYGPQVCVFTANLGFEWHIISTQGYDFSGRYRAYQIWLNTETGEIRYQYGNLNGEAANAEIGLRTRRISFIGGGDTTSKFLVSNRDAAGAVNGMGYKFTPAPPQPTRVYTVAVDSLMEGVGFLQTGYSGRFEPMIVRDPAGNLVDCADTANVLCLTMNNVGEDRMVQYVQVNTSTGLSAGAGEWTATIDAQEGHEGTFTFSALAASSIQASTLGERSLRSVGQVRIATRLGSAVDGNTLSAWLQRPNGERFGSPFTLFDDGAHGDGRAGDGIFALPDFTAPGKGVGYLWVQGQIGGADFMRSDPIPYNFQPLTVQVLNPEISFVGGVVAANVQITNHDNVQQCYKGYIDSVIVPEGWNYQWTLPPGDDGSEQLFGFCLGAGGTINRELLVTPSQAFLDGPSLAKGEVTVAIEERTRGAISANAGATITRYREATQIVLFNPLGEAAIRPNGVDPATLSLMVYDDTGLPVTDGTPVNLTTDLGTLSLAGNSGTALTGYTKQGRITLTFIAPSAPGDATVTAEMSGLTDTAIVHIATPGVHTLELVATPTDLVPGGSSAALVATVRDIWGDPVPNVAVRIGVSDDSGTQGTVNNSEVVTGVTDGNGQLTAAFAKTADATGAVIVRAEYFIETDGVIKVIADDRVTLQLSAPTEPTGFILHLPLVLR